MSLDSTDQLALHLARQAQLNKSSQYIRDFLSSYDSLSLYDRAACPTCGQFASDILFTKNGGDYCHCPRCDHVYLSNPLKNAVLNEFYANYPTTSLEWHLSESAFYKNIYSKGLDFLAPLHKASTILDVGCSSGYFLSLASLRGFQAYGIEPNIKESAYASSQGITMLGATVADLDSHNQFDVITLWDVLEHISNPVAYLHSLRGYLGIHGTIFVQVPSSDSLAARVMREACNMFDGIEHLTLFSLRSLDLAFSMAGYVPVRKQTVISETHALRNYLSYEKDPYLANALRSLDYEFLSADWIESNDLGYKIQAVYGVQS